MSTEPLHTTDVSFVPPAGLLLPTVRPEQLPADVVIPPTRFALYSTSFIHLQLAMARTLALPATEAEFGQRYGSFEQPQAPVRASAAVVGLRQQAALFGNPARLAAELAELAGGSRPTLLYGQVVWLAQRIADAAGRFSATLEMLPSLLGNTADPTQRLQMLQWLLTGTGDGLTTHARAVQAQTRTLADSLGTFQAGLQQVTIAVGSEFSARSEVYRDARERQQQLTQQLVSVQSMLQGFSSAYVGVLATVGVLALFVPVVGVLIPITIGIGSTSMGIMEQQARTLAAQLEAELKALTAESWKKAQLLADINALDLSLDPLAERLTALDSLFQGMDDAWSASIQSLQAIVATTTPEQLRDLPAFARRLRLTEGQRQWARTAQAAQEFIGNAFVRIDDGSGLNVQPPTKELLAALADWRPLALTLNKYTDSLGSIPTGSYEVRDPNGTVLMPDPLQDFPAVRTALQRARGRTATYLAGTSALLPWVVDLKQFSEDFDRRSRVIQGIYAQLAPQAEPTAAQCEAILRELAAIITHLRGNLALLETVGKKYLAAVPLLAEDQSSLGAEVAGLAAAADAFNDKVQQLVLQYTLNPMTRGLAPLIQRSGQLQLDQLRGTHGQLRSIVAQCTQAHQAVARMAGGLTLTLNNFLSVERALQASGTVTFADRLQQASFSIAARQWQDVSQEVLRVIYS